MNTLYSPAHIDCFDDLSNNQLYEILKLRSDIFVVEQNCVYPDLDDKDTHPATRHLTISDVSIEPSIIVAYARCLAPGISYQGSSIGRVAVRNSYRGKGLAQKIMNEAIHYCSQEWPSHSIQIGAQLYLQAFYENLGFAAFSDAYDEDGIMHIDMQLRTP